MRRTLTHLYLCVAAVACLAGRAFAQDAQSPTLSGSARSGNAAQAQKLQQIIDAQQRQMDAQQAQLDTQRKSLERLRQQAKSLTEGAAPPTIHVGGRTEATPSEGDELAKRADTQTRRRDDAQPHEDWSGSFGLEGLDTRFKIGGFVELDAIHDNNAIGSKGQFVTSTIVVGPATKAQGSDGQASFSVNPSRLYVETRTPIQHHRLKTFVSVDLFGNALSVEPELRLRQVYGELTNILFGGDLLIGQAWSTFSDLEAFPNTLDFQGPNSFFGTRQPLVRWTKGIGEGLKLMVAAETPNNHIIQGADSLTAWLDALLSVGWDRAPVSLRGSFVARDLRASLNGGPTETALGWGASLSGKIGLPFAAKQDFMTFSATYGKGVGSDINDQPPDAVYEKAGGGGLNAIPAFGWFVSYEHWWSRQFTSTFVYGALDVDNQFPQPTDSLNKTRYASGNLVWTPIENWLFGVELLWGKRQNWDGREGTDFRTQFTSRLTF